MEGVPARAAVSVRETLYGLFGAVDVAREAGHFSKP